MDARFHPSQGMEFARGDRAVPFLQQATDPLRANLGPAARRMGDLC
jgi:hypothetical protein